MSKTRQEIFDNAWRQFEKQGWERSVTRSIGVHCRYRGPNGRQCAIGANISDADYRPEFEGRVATDVSPRTREVLAAADIDLEDAEFATDLQIEHDHSPTDALEERMRLFAAGYALTVPAEVAR